MTDQIPDALSELSEHSGEKRLAIFKMLTSACTHLYSKGKLQEDKFGDVAPMFADLAMNDPIFMAHLTAWADRKDSKDFKVLAVYFNGLNDANGMPFFPGSVQCKPNFREVSQACLQNLDPHLALRVLELCHRKFGVDGLLNDARHFSTGMKTAFRKYLRFRESNVESLRGIKRSGLAQKMMQIYRFTRTAPSNEAASILRWKQKEGGSDIVMEDLPDFASMTSQEIADTLDGSKLSPTVALSVIPQAKITSKVAKALLGCCTGNQSIILYNWFARNGFMDVKAIKELFKDKVQQSTTAVDRIDILTKDADEDDKKEMAAVRSTKRKSQTRQANIGKIFLHIDASGSMTQAIEFAKERASIIAECVDNPAENFRWGLFGSTGRELKVPTGFTKEDFHAALYGVRANMGSTDCIALYPESRKFGADVDIYVTDQGHNIGTITKRIKEYHESHPDTPKPKAAVIVDFSNRRFAQVKNALEQSLIASDISVAIMLPEALSESALVSQSVATALVGEMAIIDEILDTPLPKLPKWWNKIGTAAKVDVAPSVGIEVDELETA